MDTLFIPRGNLVTVSTLLAKGGCKGKQVELTVIEFCDICVQIPIKLHLWQSVCAQTLVF